jgi:hypothetical protein
VIGEQQRTIGVSPLQNRAERLREAFVVGVLLLVGELLPSGLRDELLGLHRGREYA